ncbi:DUF6776 family protein [Gilvimarinus polysaccharolyticus]|uniref:DUF6776 family protein n=1 Tax=Gilvimarinus polysaccharolyticus TaxID=863921 RepID=UPI0012FC95B5|nr:DUF6776 family protein [Gilvimarinus polysaccharolyticus]
MSSVKGSKQYSMKVVPSRPGRSILRALLVLALLVAGTGGGYLYGCWTGLGGKSFALGPGDQLSTQLQESRAEAEQLRQQVANLMLSSEVDRQANDSVRNEVIALREQIASLEADITFYRGLMAPGDQAKGLKLGEMQLVARNEPGYFSYKFVVQQLATQHEVISGVVNITLVGRRAGETERLALHEVSDDVDDEDIKLRFKYFQNIEGELSLPDGFTPEKVELVAQSTGKNAAEAKKSFSWQVRDL